MIGSFAKEYATGERVCQMKERRRQPKGNRERRRRVEPGEKNRENQGEDLAPNGEKEKQPQF
jgi:hypothetical protein